MTEDEAKQKWCPLSFLQIPGSGAATNGSADNNCGASDCMMWRMTDKYDEATGYCGLAGKPE